MIRRVAEFILGQVGAQVISVAALAALAAIISGEALSSYGVALAIGSVIGANISLRIELVILASDPRLVAKLVTASLALGVLPGVTALVLTLSTYDVGPVSAGLAYGSMVSVAGTMQALLIVKQRSRLAGFLLLARSTVLAATVIGFATLGLSEGEVVTSVLAFASIGLTLAGVAICVWMVGFAPPRAALTAAASSRETWLPLLGQSIASSISLNLPYLVISQVFPSALVAAYLVSEKAVKLPITLLSYSLRSHLIPFFRSEDHDGRGRGKVRIAKWSGGIWAVSLSLIIIGSSVVLRLPIELRAVDLSTVSYTVQIMGVWAASSVALPLASAYLQAHGESRFLFFNQIKELLGKVSVLIAVVCFDPPYYLAVAAIFAWPFLANLLVVREAASLQREI